MLLSNLRTDYNVGELLEGELDANPLIQFQRWFDQALEAHLPEPNAMTLATIGANGRPSARTVLLKEVDHGFVFYTNYTSRKAQDLAACPYAALTFYWYALHRQVRVEGRVERVSADESDEYFASRPIGSRIGATASPQSQVIASRAELEQRVQQISEQYRDGLLPRPDYWGGYRLIPDSIEFWQGRPSRLHDRLRYSQQQTDQGEFWIIERLAP